MSGDQSSTDDLEENADAENKESGMVTACLQDQDASLPADDYIRNRLLLETEVHVPSSRLSLRTNGTTSSLHATA
ncbi:unnamed protein product, partial [Iphiclides podalirius]